jgi:sigma-B regulation protein RsbU (phosphoserine phosphatase)
MAYKVIILYQLYMPSYFLGTFTEYPSLRQSQKIEKFSVNSLLFSYLTGFRVFRYTSLSFNTSTALATS